MFPMMGISPGPKFLMETLANRLNEGRIRMIGYSKESFKTVNVDGCGNPK
jgi:hypothetical protein